jgi:hypothetical protein
VLSWSVLGVLDNNILLLLLLLLPAGCDRVFIFRFVERQHQHEIVLLAALSLHVVQLTLQTPQLTALETHGYAPSNPEII